MLEIIGLLTCIYLGIKIFPSVVKFTVKVAVAILLIIFGIMVYTYFYPPMIQILIA
jgi:hypothetical protein|tara:strand:+ start:631 stop:798 length:168 start_codon:yes stop_codon:yes gene_type:complete